MGAGTEGGWGGRPGEPRRSKLGCPLPLTAISISAPVKLRAGENATRRPRFRAAISGSPQWGLVGLASGRFGWMTNQPTSTNQTNQRQPDQPDQPDQPVRLVGLVGDHLVGVVLLLSWRRASRALATRRGRRGHPAISWEQALQTSQALQTTRSRARFRCLLSAVRPSSVVYCCCAKSRLLLITVRAHFVSTH